MKTRSNTTQGQIDKKRDDRLTALEKENAALRDLLTRYHKTYVDMTTDAFSLGADKDIRAEVAKFLGLETQ